MWAAASTAYHRFRDGEISISYRGDYRDYQSSLFGNGTDQNLGLSYVKRLNRRWTFYLYTSAGIYLYGNTFLHAAKHDCCATRPFQPRNPLPIDWSQLHVSANSPS